MKKKFGAEKFKLYIYIMRTLQEITREIRADWKNISPYAKPYLNAMSTLDSVGQKYGLDEGRAVVNYFLANAGGWRGEVARRVKKELNLMVK
jgi:hypothetical protein